METIKKFWKYFLLFIVAFFLIGFLTNLSMRDNYKTLSYEIKTTSPEIKVEESKVEYSHGYIKGTVTNNTGKHIKVKYLRLDLYNKDKNYVGTEYRELKYFNVDETINFDINFRYTEIDKAILSIVNEKEEVKEIGLLDRINLEDDNVKIALPIAGILILHTVLP